MCQLPAGSRIARTWKSLPRTFVSTAIASDNTDLDCWTWFTHRFRWVATKPISVCPLSSTSFWKSSGVNQWCHFSRLRIEFWTCLIRVDGYCFCAFEVTNPVLFFQSMHGNEWVVGVSTIRSGIGDSVYRETKQQCHDRATAVLFPWQ